MTNLIKENVSIKDIVYVFEKINDFADETNKEELLERIRVSLSRQISKSLCDDKDKTIYVKTIKDVEKKEIEIKSQLSHDLYVDNDKITIGQWATEWFETYKSGGEHNTVCMYKNSIEKHIIPMIGNLPLSQTKTIQLQKMLNEIVDSGKLRTADVCRLTIKQIMKCAYQERLISRDVTVGLQPIKKDTKEKKVLTKEQISSIEKAPLTDKERLFVEIIRYTGLRKGEALALTIYDIDIDKKKLYVNKSIYYDGNTAKVKDPKSRSGHRIIPIPDVLLYRLKDYIKNIDSFRLFTMTTGEYMSKQSFRIFWNHIIEKTRQSAEKLYRQETENNMNINEYKTF